MLAKKPVLLLGAHLSVAGGLENALITAQRIGASCVQIFTHSNRQWHIAPLKEEDIERFNKARLATNITHIVIHASYLINCASPEAETRHKSTEALKKELARAQQLGIPYVVLHPGSRLTSAEEVGIDHIAACLDVALAAEPGPMILLENMAGQGSSLGRSFEQLAAIRAKSTHKKRIGICFDTCHASATGYNLSDPKDYHAVWEKFDATIGLPHLKAIHLNDSKTALGSNVDRHTHIGEGSIGIEGFRLLMNDTNFFDIPKILETPKDDTCSDDIKNMDTLKKLLSPSTRKHFGL